MFGHCFNLYLGDPDTVTADIGLHMHHLATRHDHQVYLRENPKQMVVAIEEFLRAYPPVTTARFLPEPYTLGDVTFMPGDYIAMSARWPGAIPNTTMRPRRSGRTE